MRSITKLFKKTAFLLYVLFVQHSLFAQNQSDHLEPVQGLFSQYDFQAEYYSKVRQILFKGLDDKPVIRVVIIPSFGTENVVQIEHINAGDQYEIVSHAPNKSIWYSEDKSKIKAIEIRKKINDKSVILIRQLFDSVILKTNYSHGNNLALDGTEYYFSVDVNGLKTGTIWSPNENSNMGELVEITRKLIALTTGKEELIIFDQQFETEIKGLIDKVCEIKN